MELNSNTIDEAMHYVKSAVTNSFLFVPNILK
jgi:hypothetical protein